MTLILNIETTTNIKSISLHYKKKIIKQISSHAKNKYKSIFIIIKKILKQPNQIKKISAISISNGSGSCTGLRIGISIAKGICYSMNLPLISINTLSSIINYVNNKIIIYYIKKKNKILCYTNKNKKIKNIKKIKDKNFIKDFKLNKIILCKKIKYNKIKNTKLIKNICPSGSKVGILAYKKFKKYKFENINYFEPIYL